MLIDLAKSQGPRSSLDFTTRSYVPETYFSHVIAAFYVLHKFCKSEGEGSRRERPNPSAVCPKLLRDPHCVSRVREILFSYSNHSDTEEN